MAMTVNNATQTRVRPGMWTKRTNRKVSTAATNERIAKTTSSACTPSNPQKDTQKLRVAPPAMKYATNVPTPTASNSSHIPKRTRPKRRLPAMS